LQGIAARVPRQVCGCTHVLMYSLLTLIPYLLPLIPIVIPYPYYHYYYQNSPFPQFYRRIDILIECKAFKG